MVRSIEYAQLERQMYANNCSSSDFARVRRIQNSIGEYGCERLQAFMNGAKLVASTAALAVGYLMGGYVATQFCEENPVPKIVGGLTALVAAKLIAKPAARVGLDLGLRSQ